MTEASFLAQVTQLLTETGTGATLNADELELLSPDDWDDFVMGLLGFFGATGGGSDQNSYYNDHSNEAPLGEYFIQEWGWLPSVRQLHGYHFYDYLTQDIDPEFLQLAYAAYEGASIFATYGLQPGRHREYAVPDDGRWSACHDRASTMVPRRHLTLKPIRTIRVRSW